MLDSEKGLTAEKLRRLLSYEPETGVFYWRAAISPSSRAVAGDRAGWHRPDGYLIIVIDRVQYMAHRLAYLYMTGQWPVDAIDHVDLNKRNNRWGNLRPATHQQNGQNRACQSNNKTGLKGVSFDKRRGKFRAVIKVARRQEWLGYHDTAEEAYAAYVAAAKRLFGDFARVA